MASQTATLTNQSMAEQGTLEGRTAWSEVFAVFAFMLLMATNFNPFPTDQDTFSKIFEIPETGLYTAALLGSYSALTFFYACTKGKVGQATLFLLNVRPVAFALLLMLLSSLWSDFPSVTLSKALSATLAIGIILFWVVSTDSPKRVVMALYYSILALMILSLLGVAVLPERSIHSVTQFAGSWKGIFHHKNFAGGVAGIGLVMSLVFLADRRNRRLGAIGFLLCGIFLANSDSKTALFGFPAALLLYVVLQPSKRGFFAFKTVLFSVLLLAAASSYIGFAYLSPEYGFDFTGRDIIWHWNYEYALKAPYLGHGFRAVYEVGSGQGIGGFAMGFPAIAGHAHNGFLEMFGQLGLLGVASGIMVIYRPLTWGYLAVRRMPSADQIYLQAAFAVVIFQIVRACLEPDILSGTRIHWLILFACLVVLARAGIVAKRLKKAGTAA